MPTFTAFANAIPEIIDVAFEIIEVGNSASSALSKANNLEVDVNNNVKPSIDRKADNISVDNLRGVVDGNKRLSDEQWFGLSQKYGALSDEMLAQAELVNGLKSELGTIHGDLRTTKNRVDVVEPKLSNVEADMSDIKPKTSKMFSFLGAALDAVDIVGFILDIAETAALAAAIAQVGNNSLARDEALGNRINGLNNEIDEVRNMNTGQYNNIMDSLSGISQRVSVVDSNVDAVNTRTVTIDGKINTANNTISLVRNDVSDISSISNLIKEDTEDIVASTNVIQNQTSSDNLRNRAKEGACIAQIECSKESSILDGIQDIKGILGNGNFDCGGISFAGNFTHAIEAIRCGMNNGSGNGTGDNNGGDNNGGLDTPFPMEELMTRIIAALSNHLLDCRINLKEILRVSVLTNNNLSIYLNELINQQLIRFDSIEFIPADIPQWIIQLSGASAALTMTSEEVAELISDIQSSEAEIKETLNANKSLMETMADEERLDAEAPDSINGLPYVHLLEQIVDQAIA